MTQPLLRTEGLVRRFDSLVAVDDVDLAVATGEVHAIIGPNGAGKTTLFDMIAGTLAPTDGTIRFRGEAITDTPEHERARRGISRAFQITQLFADLSVHENLRLAVQASEQTLNPIATTDPSHADRAADLLSAVGIDATPTVPARTLSHGEQKRLEIGMALAVDPDLLLLDEPTSGVSQRESQQLLDFLAGASDDRTVLLVEHDVDLVMEFADRITVLQDGSIIAQGSPAEVAADETVQQAYMGGY